MLACPAAFSGRQYHLPREKIRVSALCKMKWKRVTPEGVT